MNKKTQKQRKEKGHSKIRFMFVYKLNLFFKIRDLLLKWYINLKRKKENTQKPQNKKQKEDLALSKRIKENGSLKKGMKDIRKIHQNSDFKPKINISRMIQKDVKPQRSRRGEKSIEL
ncbi:MAG: hypothetical protein IC227_06280 [Enterococcus lacertideformus]|uniref:Uncharacterized protein n=1 Tax=Enterococcus lacertideformus TaxID=2771493 RepID=A0A931B085_9ENTE|nr:hypothetical protein [Enterococcus lacertideformus]